MPAKDVKAYVKRNKNDAADAEAICEAVRRIALIVVDDPEQDPADKADDNYVDQNLHADSGNVPEPAFVRRLPPPRSRWPITPIPGMVSNRWLASFERCCTMIRFSIDPINARYRQGLPFRSSSRARAGENDASGSQP